MMTGLADNKVFVLAATLILLLVSYASAPLQNKYLRLQQVFLSEEVPAKKNATLKLVVGQLAFAAYVLGFSWFFGGVYFQVFAGGYLLSLLVGIMLGLQGILYFHGLTLPGNASGSVTFSIAFGYRNLATRIFAAGALMLGLFVFFGKFQFLGACLFTFLTSFGYMRRSWQAKSDPATPAV